MSYSETLYLTKFDHKTQKQGSVVYHLWQKRKKKAKNKDKQTNKQTNKKQNKKKWVGNNMNICRESRSLKHQCWLQNMLYCFSIYCRQLSFGEQEPITLNKLKYLHHILVQNTLLNVNYLHYLNKIFIAIKVILINYFKTIPAWRHNGNTLALCLQFGDTVWIRLISHKFLKPGW